MGGVHFINQRDAPSGHAACCRKRRARPPRALCVALAIKREPGAETADDAPLRTYTLGMANPALNLDDLTPEQKLRLLEEVWDSLAADPSAVPLTEWQRRELDRRLDEMDREGPIGIPWNRVLSEIEGRSK